MYEHDLLYTHPCQQYEILQNRLLLRPETVKESNYMALSREMNIYMMLKPLECERAPVGIDQMGAKWIHGVSPWRLKWCSMFDVSR